MLIADIFQSALKTLKTRKRQTFLTMLGIIIGIAAIVSLQSLGAGFERNVASNFDTLDADTLVMSKSIAISDRRGMGGGGKPPSSATETVDESFELYLNTSDILDEIAHVEKVVPVITRKITMDGIDEMVTIYGFDFEDYSTVISSFKANVGEIPLENNATEAIIGNTLHDPWENGTTFYSAGDNITFTVQTFTETGIQSQEITLNISASLQEIGGSSFIGGTSDLGIYVPLDYYRFLFDPEDTKIVSYYLIKLDSDSEEVIASTIEVIETMFDNEVRILSATQIISTMASTFETIQLFLTGIAAISLFVAGIGIMNIMTISLMQRTREIGILKALGMKDRTLLSIFLTEVLLIGLLGSILGIGLGFIFGNVASSFLGSVDGTSGILGHLSGGGGITITLSWSLVFSAIGFGLGTTVIFGFLPAYRASQKPPVETLRME
ncbi:ABC transporter permease [Candidatus Lokiarchaeum ossiferum]|uniref:ABC transporter permease n=1 Tax=Candidatus Lokiarchaeum ossiferum TaxID=2951803 RepID=UPI00352D69BE